MEEGQFCQSCEQRRDCRQIYEQMGNVKGSSIALSVFLVFLLPMGVFIGGLIISQGAFARLVQSPTVATVASVLFAAAMSFAVILVVKSTMRKS